MSDVETRQVVVVGSGFGGAVAACRLAQAKCDVLVLERGRWYGRGDFPRSACDRWRWGNDQGLFDVRYSGGVAVVLAAGVGGGSLLYSNVHLRMPADGFDDQWPPGWSREVLDPYYDTVAAMLGLGYAGEGPWGVPARTKAMEDAAYLVGAERDCFRPPLAVNFGPPGVLQTNSFGVGQEGCRHCGKCSVGCNHSAKNSLDKNYLPLAQQNDAVIRSRCEVMELAAEPAGGYRVTYRDHDAAVTREVVAARLVLAAGALGTTELLLRHGAQIARGGGLSPRLGERYSANGDVVTLALGIRQPWKPTAGPAITAAIVSRDEHWFLTEDGGVPPLSVLDFGVRSDYEDEPDPPPVGGLSLTPDHTAIMLGMGRDSGTGRIEARGRVSIDWPYAENEPYYRAVSSYHRDLGRALDEVAHVDAGLTARMPVSVHSLGGAVMGRDPDRGVVDQHGEVFGACGVYVFDGAAIPTATGVNPSNTIAAVAERNAEHLARCLTGEPDWQSPERKNAPVFVDPLPAP